MKECGYLPACAACSPLRLPDPLGPSGGAVPVMDNAAALHVSASVPATAHQRMLSSLGEQLRRIGAALEEHSKAAVWEEEAANDAFRRDLQAIARDHLDKMSQAEEKALLQQPITPNGVGNGRIKADLEPSLSPPQVEVGDGARLSTPSCALTSYPLQSFALRRPLSSCNETSARGTRRHKTGRSGSSRKTKATEFGNPDVSSRSLDLAKDQFKRLVVFTGATHMTMSRVKKVCVSPENFHSFLSCYLTDEHAVTQSQLLMLLRELSDWRDWANRSKLSVTSSKGSYWSTRDGDVLVSFDLFLELSLGSGLSDYLSVDAFDAAKRIRHGLHEEECAHPFVRYDIEGAQETPLDSQLLKSEILSSTVILLNALVLGLSADIARDHTVWRIAEYCFTTFFSAEIVIKIIAFGLPKFFLGPDMLWNWFDSIVVAIALFDAAITLLLSGGDQMDITHFSIVKIIRLARLGRLIRLLRFSMFEELKMMVIGVFSGLRVLFWAIALFFFFVYTTGLVMRETMGNNEAYYTETSFSTVPWAMYTLFRCFTDGCSADDGTPLPVHLYRMYGAGFMFLYMLTFLFVSIGLFNLIMAIFVENVLETNRDRRFLARQCEAARATRKLRNVLSKLAGRITNQPQVNVKVTRDIFLDWLEDPEFTKMCENLDIQMTNRSDMFDVLDANGDGDLSVEELTTGMMKLRGPAEKSDAIASWLCVRAVQSQIAEFEERIMRSILAISAMSRDIVDALEAQDNDTEQECVSEACSTTAVPELSARMHL